MKMKNSPQIDERRYPESFRGMVMISVAAAVIAMVVGLALAAAFSLPTGPTIVLAAAGLFVLAAVRGILQSK